MFCLRRQFTTQTANATSVLKRFRVRLSVCPTGSARGSGKGAQRRAMRIVGCIRHAGRVNFGPTVRRSDTPTGTHIHSRERVAEKRAKGSMEFCCLMPGGEDIREGPTAEWGSWGRGSPTSMEERCKLPQPGPGQSPDHSTIFLYSEVLEGSLFCCRSPSIWQKRGCTNPWKDQELCKQRGYQLYIAREVQPT